MKTYTENNINDMGVNSYDDFLQYVPENGQNYYNEQEDSSGGLSSSRGDVGCFNLRNIGVGRTTVLMNGRRMLSESKGQREFRGGGNIITKTVNSNIIPIQALSKVTISTPGSSILNGPNSSFGIVNNVFKKDFKGSKFTSKFTEMLNFGTRNYLNTYTYGKQLNDKTNIGVFISNYSRDRIRALDDNNKPTPGKLKGEVPPENYSYKNEKEKLKRVYKNGGHSSAEPGYLVRWAAGDHRYFIPDDNLWNRSTSFRNTSSYSLYGQFDMVNAGTEYNHIYTDNSGEFEVFPLEDPRGINRGNPLLNTGYGTCIAPDGNGTIRSNYWAPTDVYSNLNRNNIYAYLNHSISKNLELYSEFTYYNSDTHRQVHASNGFSSSKHRVGPNNYYLNQIKINSPHKGAGTNLFKDQPLFIDSYRYEEKLRQVYNDRENTRFLVGLKGNRNKWDYDTAVIYSEDIYDEVTKNRLSNILLKEALLDITSAAYNPFSAGKNSNIERALIDVSVNAKSTLLQTDFTTYSPNLYTTKYGNIDLDLSLEYSIETLYVNYDDRINGTIKYTDYEGDTYPKVSDVVSSSPFFNIPKTTRDTSTLQISSNMPVYTNTNISLRSCLNLYSDIDNTLSYSIDLNSKINKKLSFTSVYSKDYNIPNLNLKSKYDKLVRTGTRYDYCDFIALQLPGPIWLDTDARYSIERQQLSAGNIKSEKIKSLQSGLQVNPNKNLNLSVNFWLSTINDEIGIFSRENHSMLDAYVRCKDENYGGLGQTGNPNVIREEVTESKVDDDWTEERAKFFSEPFGDINYVIDSPSNIANLEVSGYDYNIQQNFNTNSIGNFNIDITLSHITKHERKLSDKIFDYDSKKFQVFLNKCIDANLLNTNLKGYGDLLKKDGIHKTKILGNLSWQYNDYKIGVLYNKISSFVQTSLPLQEDPVTGQQVPYMIPSMSTIDLSVEYKNTKFRINNIENKRAPVADTDYGYYADAHNDLGRNVSGTLQFNF